MVWNNLCLHLCNVSLSARQGLMVWQEVFHVTRIWSHHFQPSRTFSALPRYILVKKKKKRTFAQRLKIQEFGPQSKDDTESLFFIFRSAPRVFPFKSTLHFVPLKMTCESLSDRKEAHAEGDLKKKIRTQKCKIQSLLKTKTVCFKGACRVIAGAGSTYKFKRTS